ncbi:MAG: FtsX-like permease family protein [Candidatus Lokiarchaeota archaeon]|nr:FtsX-like permease family protein [Candidatus Lokiarchaeota archaeon]
MTKQDYASKDLRRRPFRSALTIFTMASVIAATTFLFLFGSVLLDITAFVSSTGLNSSFGVFFETFIWGTLLMAVVLGGAVVSSTISLEMISRRRDIGLMKAVGTLMDTLFDHFMAQAVILLLLSIVIGLTTGLLLYIIGMIWLANVITGAEFSFVFPYLQLAAIAGIYFFMGFFAAQKPIYETVNESPISALNPEIGMRVRRVGYLDTFGLSFRLATKATGRRIKGSRRTILSLMLSFSLASLLWIGGGITSTTTNAYVTRAMGSNIVAVGNSNLLNTYYDAYSLSGERIEGAYNFTESQYILPTPMFADLNDIDGVDIVEQRMIDYQRIYEGPAIIWNPTLEQYERIGKDRTNSSLIVGIDWEHTISDWYFEGSEIEDSQQVWIGGELATTMYEDPLIQRLGVKGASMEIAGIAFDILNGGMLAMLPLDTMQDLWGVSGSNLALVQIEDYSASVIEEIEMVANSYGFSITLQQNILDENLRAINLVWNLLQPLPLIALVSAFASLANYLLVSVFGRFDDYVIMRAIGAKPKFIAKTMIAEGLDIGLKAGLPGVLASVFFSVFLLVPEAAVPSTLFLPLSIVTMLISLVVIVSLAAVPVYFMFSRRNDLKVSEFFV